MLGDMARGDPEQALGGLHCNVQNEQIANAIRSDRTLLGAPGRTTRSKKLLGAKGISTSNKDATRMDLKKMTLNNPSRNPGTDVSSKR